MPHEHVVITGGCGFLGSAIVDAFLKAHPQYDYTILDIRPPKQGAAANRELNFVRVDVRDAAAVREAVRKTAPTVIVHSAGIVPGGSKRYSKSKAVKTEVFDVNVGGTRNVLDAARDVESVRAFVYTSSLTVVGDDLDTDYCNVDESVQTGRAELFYGQSKAAAERLVLSPATPHDFLACVLRPSVIFGPGDPSLLPPITALAPSTPPRSPSSFLPSLVPPIPLSVVALGPCTNLYDFTYVTNAADAHVLAVRNLLQASSRDAESAPSPPSHSAAGRAFFITNDAPLPFRDFCRAVWAELGHVPPAEIRVPATMARAMGFSADAVSALTGAEFALSAGAVRDALGTKYASGKAAREVLGYVPRVGMKEGVRRAVEDYKQRMQQQKENGEAKKISMTCEGSDTTQPAGETTKYFGAADEPATYYVCLREGLQR